MKGLFFLFLKQNNYSNQKKKRTLCFSWTNTGEILLFEFIFFSKPLKTKKERKKKATKLERIIQKF